MEKQSVNMQTFMFISLFNCAYRHIGFDQHKNEERNKRSSLSLGEYDNLSIEEMYAIYLDDEDMNIQDKCIEDEQLQLHFIAKNQLSSATGEGVKIEKMLKSKELNNSSTPSEDKNTNSVSISSLNLITDGTLPPIAVQQSNTIAERIDCLMTISPTEHATENREVECNKMNPLELSKETYPNPMDFSSCAPPIAEHFDPVNSPSFNPAQSSQTKPTSITHFNRVEQAQFESFNPINSENIFDLIRNTGLDHNVENCKIMQDISDGLVINKRFTEFLDRLILLHHSSAVKQPKKGCEKNSALNEQKHFQLYSNTTCTKEFSWDIMKDAFEVQNIINIQLLSLEYLCSMLDDLKRVILNSHIKTLHDYGEISKNYRLLKNELFIFLRFFLDFHSNITVFSAIVSSTIDQIHGDATCMRNREHHDMVTKFEKTIFALQNNAHSIAFIIWTTNQYILSKLAVFSQSNSADSVLLLKIQVPESLLNPETGITEKSTKINMNGETSNQCEPVEMIRTLTNQVKIEKDQLQKAVERLAFFLTYDVEAIK